MADENKKLVLHEIMDRTLCVSTMTNELLLQHSAFDDYPELEPVKSKIQQAFDLLFEAYRESANI